MAMFNLTTRTRLYHTDTPSLTMSLSALLILPYQYNLKRSSYAASLTIPLLATLYTHHPPQVRLTAKYHPEKLMALLKQSNYIPLKDAMQICEEHRMIPEMVFLLQRVGNIKKALELIITELGDVSHTRIYATAPLCSR